MSVFIMHLQEYHDACLCRLQLVNKVQRICVLHQTADSCVSERALETDMKEKKLLNEVIIFVFYVHKNFS